MHLTNLPLTAFQCIIEHMVANLDLYKAIRLRSICSKYSLRHPESASKGEMLSMVVSTELFDAEVTRAVFLTSNFAFDKYRRSFQMTPECVTLLLKGSVARARRRGQSQLSFAINKTVEALLDGAKDKTGDRRLSYSSALCDAVAYSMVPWQVFYLLKNGLEVAGGEFVLSQHLLAGAVAIGDIDRVQLLLSKGPNEHLESAFFGDAMQNAARTGREDILNLLIQNGTNASLDMIAPNAVAETFIAACASGHASIVHLLLSYSEANALDVFRPELAVTAAARNGHVALIQALLERFDLPNNHNLVTRAAFAASSRGYSEVVQMLLNYTLDVNVVNLKGQNLLHHAARGGHARVVQLLLDHGVSYYESRRGDPLYLAAINGHQDVVQLLLDHGANFKAQGRDYCVLTGAAQNGESSMIRFLVERKFDLHAHNCADAALAFAAERCHEETVRLLVGMGAHVDGCCGKHGPICRAKIEHRHGVVNALLELGAKDVDPLDSEHERRRLYSVYDY